MQGLLGRKIGMTRVFNAQGHQVPVTVIQCGPCVVLQRKTVAREGYDAVQLGFETVPERRASRATLGACKAAACPPPRHRAEVSVEPGEAAKPGDTVTVALFKDVPYVDVIGVTKGKGFQGVMSRHRMSGGVVTHGGHSKRRVGSVGCRELPGRIHKGKRMPGHKGAVRVTLPNVKVEQVRVEDHALLVRGAVPGHAGSLLLVRRSLKRGQTP